MVRTLEKHFNQTIRINSEISITVLQMQDGKVKIAIEAPTDVPVFRCKVTDYRIPPSQRAPGESYPSPAAAKPVESTLGRKVLAAKRQRLRVFRE